MQEGLDDGPEDTIVDIKNSIDEENRKIKKLYEEQAKILKKVEKEIDAQR